MQEESLSGQVYEIVNRNKDNIVFGIKTPAQENKQILCPFFCPLHIHDLVYIARANRKNDGTYQALTQPYVEIPQDPDRIKEYFVKILRGSKFGAVTADKLYRHIEGLARSYNKETVPFLSEMAEQYCDTGENRIVDMVIAASTLRLINHAQGRKLLTEWFNKRAMRRLHLLGLTNKEIQQAGVTNEELFDICINNPYRIASVHYDKCDRILRSTNRDVPDSARICGRINRYVFEQIYDRGNTCVPEVNLRKAFPHYDSLLESLVSEYYLTVADGNVYTQKVYRIETAIFEYISSLLPKEKEEFAIQPSVRLDRNFYERKTLTQEQENAISGALKDKICIITGGAGTGKSEIIKEITRNLSIREKSYSVCAFTGKAVAKLHSVMCNDEATTIDRLILEVKKGMNQLGSHIIIDEGSMVTMELFYRLINAIDNRNVRITIVGDCNQLPPIGWGNLMRELILSERIPVYRLTKNQRIIATNIAEDEKTILENANALIDPARNPRTPVNFKEGNGFYVLGGGIVTVGHIVKGLYQSGIDCNTLLILSPYKAYIDELNTTVQEIYLENAFKFIQRTPTGDRVWRVGDRVMMTKNNYDIGVMNGEEGHIDGIDDEGLKVRFKDTIYNFSFDIDKAEDKDDDIEDAKKFSEPEGKSEAKEPEPLLSSDLIHSFAVSIHKSQGSEADYVILYLEEKTASSNFLNINLLYTAITRTRKTIWVVSPTGLLERVSTTPLQHKFDGLANRLKL